MNKHLLSAITASIIAFPALAEEQVNYGDPTASFSTLGVSRSDSATQLNGMAGFGKHIFSMDITRSDKNDWSGRGRYFYVTDGLGGSVDVVADEFSTTVLAGGIYKIKITDNIMLFPMVSAGKFFTKDKGIDSNLGQLGLYGMYAFDSGHWLYANPKTTYLAQPKEWVNQVEVGGGYMLTDNMSVGAKIEYTAKTDFLDEDSVGWVQFNYYF